MISVNVNYKSHLHNIEHEAASIVVISYLSYFYGSRSLATYPGHAELVCMGV